MKIEYNVCLFFSDKSCCIMRQNGTFAPFKFYKEETAPPVSSMVSLLMNLKPTNYIQSILSAALPATVPCINL